MCLIIHQNKIILIKNESIASLDKMAKEYFCFYRRQIHADLHIYISKKASYSVFVNN